MSYLQVSRPVAMNKQHGEKGIQSQLYRMSQEECAGLREGVPYVKVYR